MRGWRRPENLQGVMRGVGGSSVKKEEELTVIIDEGLVINSF